MSSSDNNQNMFESLSLSRSVSPVSSVDEVQIVTSASEFPTLSESKSVSKNKGTTFKVATSYKQSQIFKAKTQSDASVALKYTRPCNNIAKDQAGEYGVCTRSVCTFAHSKAQFVPKTCNFLEKCRNMHCVFFHPDSETRNEFLERSGIDLPDTHENTYKPYTKGAKLVPKAITTVKKVCPVNMWKNADKNKEEDAKMQAICDGYTDFEPESPVVAKPSTKSETVLRVPKEMFEATLMMVLSKGLTNVKIEVSD
jgi:hypothetical protein